MEVNEEGGVGNTEESAVSYAWGDELQMSISVRGEAALAIAEVSMPETYVVCGEE